MSAMPIRDVAPTTRSITPIANRYNGVNRRTRDAYSRFQLIGRSSFLASINREENWNPVIMKNSRTLVVPKWLNQCDQCSGEYLTWV